MLTSEINIYDKLDGALKMLTGESLFCVLMSLLNSFQHNLRILFTTQNNFKFSFSFANIAASLESNILTMDAIFSEPKQKR